MSPEERQMLTDLFERVRGQANAPRDRDAETLIADAVRTQPYAPYLLTQAVLLQEQALRAADQKLQEMQAQVAHLQDELAHAQAQPASGAGSFLGGLFGGGGASRPAPQQPPANPNPWGGGGQQQPGYAPQQQQGGPWGAPQPQQAGPAAGPWGAPQPQQGGGFLKGALGAAAGVAGGMLLADSFKGLFGGGQANAAGLGGGLADSAAGSAPAPAARGSSIITMRRRSPRTTRLTIMTMIPATTTTRQTMISRVAATITATISDRSTKKRGWPRECAASHSVVKNKKSGEKSGLLAAQAHHHVDSVDFHALGQLRQSALID